VKDENLTTRTDEPRVADMRTLTRDELVSETLTRIMLNRGRAASNIDRQLVTLIADMITLAAERVPECYTQATETPPTQPPRRSFVCATCDGKGYVSPIDTSRNYHEACPDCQGRG
jgi:hypothetical protein